MKLEDAKIEEDVFYCGIEFPTNKSYGSKRITLNKGTIKSLRCACHGSKNLESVVLFGDIIVPIENAFYVENEAAKVFLKLCEKEKL